MQHYNSERLKTVLMPRTREPNTEKKKILVGTVYKSLFIRRSTRENPFHQLFAYTEKRTRFEKVVPTNDKQVDVNNALNNNFLPQLRSVVLPTSPVSS